MIKSRWEEEKEEKKGVFPIWRSSQHGVGAEEFVVTKEYRRFLEFCEACRRSRRIGICWGVAGVGKSLSARHYGQWDDFEPHIPCSVQWDLPISEGWSKCETAIYTPAVTCTPSRVTQEVVELCRSVNYIEKAIRKVRGTRDRVGEGILLIVDEADRLNMKSVEVIRDLSDRNRMGVVFIGMPGIEKKLSRYGQLYSRVRFVHEYKELSREELRHILEEKWSQLGMSLTVGDFLDEEAVGAIVRITGGNFRVLETLLSEIERLLEVNEMKMVSKEVVELARESLVLGIA